MSTHHAKFARLHCNARPIASHAAQIIATNDEVSTPIRPATVITRSAFRRKFTRLLRNFAIVTSKCHFVSHHLRCLLNQLTTLIPTKRIIIHTRIGGRYSRANATIIDLYSASCSGEIFSNIREGEGDVNKIYTATLALIGACGL